MENIKRQKMNSVKRDVSNMPTTANEDEMDTNPILAPPSTVQGTNEAPTQENYKMQHKRRGVALIFNQETFGVDKLETRLGAKKDEEDIVKTLKALRFEVRAYKDSTEQQIKEELFKVSNQDHSNSDCLMVVMMTHGKENGYLYAKDRSYNEENVWKMFTADRVPSLAGKPKIFIFQACRGNKHQESDLAFDSVEDRSQCTEVYSVPTLADFLIVHSTMEGHISWRNKEEGTMYIQDFCKVINENTSKRDFVQLLTLVSGRVALSRQDDLHMQMPELTSTLTKFIYF